MKSKIKNIMLITLGVVLGLTVGVSAATTIAASQVTYNNTTVQAKLDELVDIANNMVLIDPDTFQTNTAKTVYASSKGLCMQRNGKFTCFKIKNYDVEKDHIKQAFPASYCNDTSSGVVCNTRDFYCSVTLAGDVRCVDQSDSSGCFVDSAGTVDCN